MARNETKLSEKLPRGRPRTTHGGYTFLVKGVVPERRRYLLSYLSAGEGSITGIGLKFFGA